MNIKRPSVATLKRLRPLSEFDVKRIQTLSEQLEQVTVSDEKTRAECNR
ncbi:MAG: hypothetical protein ISR69_06340 [Gammaproteobacteria bacterium]|nr:hypothetical protein [Gammaproteobacteria bacterium]